MARDLEIAKSSTNSFGNDEAEKSSTNSLDKDTYEVDVRPIDEGKEGTSSSDEDDGIVGAPVEKVNPLGTHVNYVELIYIVVSGVIGTGIFGTPGTILKSLGSVGASYVLWICGYFIAMLKLSIYIEYVTYFSDRSGGEVVFLEKAYPKPVFMVPTIFAATNVILSFVNSSAIAFASYILKAADVEATTWRQRGLGIGVLTATSVLVALSTKWSLKLSNFLGHIKVITLAFIAVLGFVVLGGHTKVENPKANFSNVWEGSTSEPHAIASAIIKVAFSYGGTGMAINICSELPQEKRMFGFTRLVPLTFFIIFIFYILSVTAFFAGAGTVDEIKGSGVLISAQFFQNVFKTDAAAKALSVLVAISAFGHLIPTIIAHSRSLRECGRQGVLPFRNFWVSTKPFGTPLGPIAATWLVSFIVTVGPPAGSAYNFIINLGAYSNYVFDILTAVGLLLVRRRRRAIGLGSKGWKVPFPIVILQIIFQVFVLAMPLVPPADGSLIGSDVDFFYATYCIVAVGLLLVCVLYYIAWQYVFPKARGYRNRIDVYTLENGELGNRVIKVPVAEVEEWDRVHFKGPKTLS